MSFGTKTVTLFRAAALALVLLCLATLLMPCLTLSIRESKLDMTVGINIFSTAIKGRFTSFWSVMLIINAILLILLGGLAIFGLIKDVKILLLPFTFISFITFFLALFQKLFIAESTLHVGRGPWLLLFLSLLACGAAILDHVASGKSMKELFDLSALGIKLPAKPVRPAAPLGYAAPAGYGAPAGWVCPACGTAQPVQVRFCGNCGASKPAPRICPGCGKACQPNEAFCADCGTRL